MDPTKLPAFPPEAVRRYRDAGLWGSRTLAEEFHAVASAHAGRTAVVSAEGELSFAELDKRTDRLAAGLHAAGLRPGDPVLFQLTNRLHTVLAWYGTLKAGLVPVATLALHRRHEIGQIAARTGAVAHLVEVGPDDKFDLVAMADAHRRDCPTMRYVLTAGTPEAKAGCLRLEGLGADLDPAGARRLVQEIQNRLDPDDVAVFQLSGGTTGVPKVIPRRHAEYWYNAVAYARRLDWDATSRVAHLIPIIHNAGIVCGLHAPHSVGARLVLGTPKAERSRRAEGHRPGHRATGELCCRGPYTIPGYYDAPEYDAIAFTSDGFYRTGDLASVHLIDGRRCLSIDGRIKDLIDRGGEKINAGEVELLLLHHPGIEQAAVVAMPDPKLGERACAFLVATGPTLALPDIQRHLDALEVVKYKWPERLEWVRELPRSKVNKVDKAALRKRAATLTLARTPVP